MMIFLMATLAVAILGWVWGSRGFFSALIHLVCVIIAGAIAFGVWELAGYALLDAAGNRKWLMDIAWGVSLAVPFAVVLAILRLSIDKALPFNTDLDGTSNLLGGIVCGVVSGVISIGILTISITNLRISTDSIEYTMVDYDTNGSIVKESGYTTLYPRLTAGFYAFLSQNSLRTSTPMSVWRPDVAYEGSMLRTNFNNGTSRYALQPKAVSFVKRYTVGEKETGLDVKSFLADAQTVTTFGDRSTISGSDKNHYLEGYVVQFKSGARELDGRIVIGAAQVQLVVRSPDDSESRTLFPVAMISQSDIQEGDVRVRYWRWPFSSARTFIASVGGADDPSIGFEFLTPKGWKPLSLSVKGVRFKVEDMASPQTFKDSKERTDAIKRYEVISLPAGAVGAKGDRDWPRDITAGLRTTAYVVQGNQTSGDSGIVMSDALPLNIILSADDRRGLTIDDKNFIMEGEAAFRNTDLKDMRGVDQKIQIRRIGSDDTTTVVQVNISNNSPIAYTKSKLAIDGIGAPVLVDNLGQRYSAIGYVYKDATSTRLRITPGSPVGSIADLPDGGPSSSRSDQEFVLIYRVTANVKIKTFEIGTSVVVKIDPNIDTKKN